MSEKLTYEKARQILPNYVKTDNLVKHSVAVSSAMGAFAKHYNEDVDYWKAIGYLHDVDYELYPTEHLQHTEEILKKYDVSDSDIHSIITHGWGLCSDQKPETLMEKTLYTIDELTGIVLAAAYMRPTGISDITPKSVMKKYKDKAFAAKCDRALISGGCEMLAMSVADAAALCIEGMQGEAAALGFAAAE